MSPSRGSSKSSFRPAETGVEPASQPKEMSEHSSEASTALRRVSQGTVQAAWSSSAIHDLIYRCFLPCLSGPSVDNQPFLYRGDVERLIANVHRQRQAGQECGHSSPNTTRRKPKTAGPPCWLRQDRNLPRLRIEYVRLRAGIARTDSPGEARPWLTSLLVRGNLTPGEQDYLDVLTDIVERYEDETHPMPEVSDAAMLRHLIDASGVTQV